MSKIEIVDDSISMVDQSRIETLFSGKFIGWFYDEYTVNTAKNYRPQMVHSVFHCEEGVLSESFHLLYEVFSEVMPEWNDENYKLSRIKANMNFQHNNKSLLWHKDTAQPGVSYLYYIHDSDGPTYFKTGLFPQKVHPKIGRLVKSDTSVVHSGSVPKKFKVRRVINFLFEKNLD
jgi:hypothetical protein